MPVGRGPGNRELPRGSERSSRPGMRTFVAAAAVALALASTATGAASFAPSGPLAAKQRRLAANRSCGAWRERPPPAQLLAAALDAGSGGTEPDLVNKIAGARSCVGGSAWRDQQGHGTFVAGLIAAEVGNAT